MLENNVEQVRNKIVTEFAKTIEMFDLTPLEARLFAYLYLSEKALTLDEMSDALGKSKTSMSNSIRSLYDMNLVTLVWKKGVRKDLYQSNSQLFKLFMTTYINKWIDATNHQKDALTELEHNLSEYRNKPGKNDEWDKLTKQLDDIMEFHKKLDSFFREMK
ncbi:DNA-binding transcriptional regulator GbsR, MarR family [Oceanobacillus limi]|uniref:HTH-type transcriptional regulator n=1 Tax=Oceanobacillus limi TaxID=930131 RepID=A0A1H9YKQ3_9BACI|nr:MarR family transcriptional regulator [Oceanobacillus limi]SES69658.1 DNA-binding transcriptional regulator GbsR, MarR family [Oceanobacillus limi]